jgi:acyl-CoA synthetase (AMP-forming)/AMP-acid ligase II
MLLHHLLLDGAHRAPDRTALHWVDRDRSLTYREALDATEAAAGAFASLGVTRGDRVGVFAHNGLDYLLAMFGAWRLGAVAALVNVAYADELDWYVKDCSPKVLVYTGDHEATIARHRAAMSSVRHYLCLDGPQDGALAWPALLDAGLRPPPEVAEEGDVAHLSYTSGTSGRPKGACLAHEPTARATRCIAERLRIEADDVCFGPTALSSSYQLVANLLPALHRTATVCVMSRWTPATGVDALERTGATVLAANPTVLTDVLDEARRRGGPPPRLRLSVSGGAPVPPELKRAWRDELGLTLAESYGQSELGGFVGLGAPDPMTDARLLACGRPLPDKEVRIVDDEGREMPIGSSGEIVLRGGCMTGYWNRPEATADALRDGWLHTGDVGVMDADGFVYMRGRLSERLSVQGEWWYPRDLEEALLTHPGVRLAAVIGLPDDELGQRPTAYVTPTDGADLDPAGLAASTVDHLGRPVPGFSVVVADELPMTPTGKISKAQLLELAVPA